MQWLRNFQIFVTKDTKKGNEILIIVNYRCSLGQVPSII